MKLFFLVPLLVVTTTIAFADPSPRVATYINKYKHIAIREMHRTGVPASITIAQGIIESDCGKSRVAKVKNNHFGVKRGDAYKRYASVIQSFVDHSNLLVRNRRYARLIRTRNVNHTVWTRTIGASSYASDTRYTSKLTACIRVNDLSQLDKQAL